MELSVIFSLLTALMATALGVVPLPRKQRSAPDWMFAIGMTVLGVESLFSGLSLDVLLPEDKLRWELRKLMVSSLGCGVWLMFSLTYARGNYREFLARWRWGLAATFFVPPALALTCQHDLVTGLAQTSRTGWSLELGYAGFALNICYLLVIVAVLANFEKTFRASVGTMRWRIKYLILGLGCLFGVRAYVVSQALVFRGINLSLEPLKTIALALACLLILRSLFRTGGGEVSVYPSHSILHKSLIVFLAGTYLVVVGVFAKIVTLFGGNSAFELKALLVLVALVLLSVLLVSDRVRLVSKRFVSQHFQRPTHDYRAIWKAFSEATAHCVEPEQLSDAVAKLVSHTFQVLSVSVWLINRRKELALASSTTLSHVPTGLTIEPAATDEITAALSNQLEPVDLDKSREDWAGALRRSNLDQFPNGGDRICVPLVAPGELLGLVILGDRVSGIPYSLQDLDLMKAISHQVASALLNIRLSQNVAQGKQLEAFQAMSAFFVHDLKNTASTLSLMLQNLPVHYGDPAFRQDALRGISTTVDHINDLVNRLTCLRQSLSSQPIETDLNGIVEQALAAFPVSPGLELKKAFQTLPNIMVDPGQIQNVLTNLLLNARDAVGPSGRIEVQSSRSNGWAIVSVTDTGCGMSQDFVQNSLFRPFKTTKKKGLGIGVFQCKTIVEAHHGRLEVESTPGKGTTFRVLLPVGD